MPKIDLSHFDPNKTHAIKVNVYKPEGFSSLWKWLPLNPKKNIPPNKLGLNLKLNLEEVEKIKMDQILRKVQDIETKHKKKQPSNFGNVLNIKKHGIDLTRNQILKEQMEKSPQMRRFKPLKPNVVCPYRKCVISSSSLSVSSKKGTVATNVKYSFFQTTKLKGSPRSSSTSLRVGKSSDSGIRLKNHQPQPIAQNILVKGVPSAVRKTNTQRKIIKPQCKNKSIRLTPTKLQPTKPLSVPDEIAEVNLLPSLITKIKSMEKQIHGMQNAAKEIKGVESEKKLEIMKKTHSVNVISHKLNLKNLNQTRKTKQVKVKKLKPKSKITLPKNEGFKLKYPVVPEFHFNSCSESSNRNKTGINFIANPGHKNAQILINKQEIKFPLHIPNTNVTLEGPSDQYEVLLNFLQTLSDIKSPTNEIRDCSLPLVREVELDPIESQGIPVSIVPISSDLNLVDAKLTELKESFDENLKGQETLPEHSLNTEAEENMELNQTDSLDQDKLVLNSIENESNVNQAQETPQSSEVSIEANSPKNSDENNEILREILNFTKLIISKLDVDPTKFPSLSEMKKNGEETNKENENPDIPTGPADIVKEEETGASSDNQEQIASTTSDGENNKLEERPECIVSSDSCEVEAKASKESVTSHKSEMLDTGTSAEEDPPNPNITILVEENKKDELEVGSEVVSVIQELNEVKNNYTKPVVGPQGDHCLSTNGETSKNHNFNQEDVKAKPCDSLPDRSFQNLCESPKQNFCTKLETNESIILKNYSLESQGTYLDHEKRKAFDQNVRATKHKIGTKQVQQCLNSVPVIKKHSNVSNSIEPYEQFIETSIVSKQTSYSKTKFNMCQEKDFTSFHQPFDFHDNSFPAIECVTSENKVDVTAKYTSKQHIIHHRKRDQSRNSNFEKVDSFYKLRSRQIGPSYIDEDRSNVIHRGNKIGDEIDLRRRPCRFNLTLQRDRILEEKDDHVTLEKFPLNEVQAEKGDCLVFQANYDNHQGAAYNLLMNQLEDDKKVAMGIVSEDKDLKPTNNSEVNLVAEKVSVAVQTDLSLFEGFINDLKATSSCQFNEIDNKRSITTQTESAVSQLHESFENLADDICENKISEVTKNSNKEDEGFSKQEEGTEGKKENEEETLTIKIQNKLSTKVAGIFIGIIQERSSDSTAGSKIYDVIEGKETPDFGTSSLVLQSNFNKPNPTQEFVLPGLDISPKQLNEESNIILEDLDRIHRCPNLCLTTVSEETVISNLTESSKFSEESLDKKVHQEPNKRCPNHTENEDIDFESESSSDQESIN